MKQAIKKFIKNHPLIKRWSLFVIRIGQPFMGIARPSSVFYYWFFFREWKNFRRLGGKACLGDLYPCLFDRSVATNIDTHYFYQGIWAFRKITESQATPHIDIGSQVDLVGFLTTIIPVIFVDIRPLFLNIPNYLGIGGSICNLPFADRSINSLSCLHVIEHIGLGRYGDPIDPLGSIKAAKEIVRVLAEQGQAYISAPIGRSRVCFNGHRVFSIQEVIKMFAGLRLQELSVVDASGAYHMQVNIDSVDINEAGAGNDFGLGMFWFVKPNSIVQE